MIGDPREDAAADSLVEQSDHFTLRALEAVRGARSDVGNLALLTAAFAAARHYVALQVPADEVESTVTKLIEHAVEFAREYSKVLVEDGTIKFSETVRTHERSDAEKRLLGIREPDETPTVGSELPKEIERVTELRALYLSVPNGFIAAALMTSSIEGAKAAIAAGDVIAQSRALEDLRGYHE